MKVGDIVSWERTTALLGFTAPEIFDHSARQRKLFYNDPVSRSQTLQSLDETRAFRPAEPCQTHASFYASFSSIAITA